MLHGDLTQGGLLSRFSISVVPQGFEPCPSVFQADVLPVTPENHVGHFRQT